MLKNIGIGKRLIISFVAIAVLASIVSGISIFTLQNIDSNYSAALKEHGFSQGDIGKALSAFCRLDGNVHDALNFMDNNIRNDALTNISELRTKIPAYFNAVEANLSSDEQLAMLNKAKSSWKEYLEKAQDIAGKGNPSDVFKTAQLQKRVTDELMPLYNTIYTSLDELMTSMVDTGNAESNELTNASNASMLMNICFTLLVTIISILFGVFISRGISRPIVACEQRLELLSKGDIHTSVPETSSRDETGEMLRSLKATTDYISDIFKEMERILMDIGSGNLVISSDVDFKGDFVQIKKSMSSIADSLHDTISQINRSSEQVASGSEQVSSGAQALSQGATEQASAVEELSATIAEISSQIKKNASTAAAAKKQTDQTGQNVLESNKRMQELISAMDEINGKSTAIEKIIKTIDDIAFNTNILALNAAVEAARAGSAGKGFVVVADEVRNLAGKSAAAVKSTAALIAETIASVKHGAQIADQAAKSMLAVVDGSSSVTALIENIASASANQATSAAQVTAGVEQISAVVQTNSATAEESAAASEELSGQAQILKSLVGRFTLKDEDNDSYRETSSYTEY